MLQAVLKLVNKVHKARSTSLMSAGSLATIFAPTFFHLRDTDQIVESKLRDQIKITRKLIKYQSVIFTDVRHTQVNLYAKVALTASLLLTELGDHA